MDKYIGRLLDNRYEILEEIGSGGMAVVYKARCHRLNRLVAIKILKDDYLQDEDFRRRFHAESHAVAMLSHPNIVQVYDVFDSDEADYIVMELIDGISLKQYMEKKGVLNWKETLHFAIQIAKALEHAHSRGIVHRDIKPHNVMVLKNGSVKVTDFGIARMMSKGNTLTKEALGSVHYISPEQAKGGRVDNRSDIYSLGVVMYEMMSGRPPYDGESPVAVAIQHINGGAVMPSTLNPNIPGGLEQIIMKAMALSVSERFDSASAMLHDLDEFRKDPSVLFDYNALVGDDVMQIKKPPLVLEPAATTAERVAEKAEQAANSIPVRSKREDISELPKRRRTTQSKKTLNTSTIAIIACSAVIILALIILIIVGFSGNGKNSMMVQVPSFVGKTYATLGEYEDFVFKYEEVFDDNVPAGEIISQIPDAGDEVVKGTEIHFKVSKGKESAPTVMPNVIKQNKNQAQQILNSMSLGIKISIEEEYDDSVIEGCIIKTSPAAGETLSLNQVVVLYVSKGKEDTPGAMPQIVDKTVDEAKSLLDKQEMDLTYEVIEENHATIGKGVVIRSEPEAGDTIKKGQTITIYISSGPEPLVPDFNGMTLEQAKSALNALDLNLQIQEIEENSSDVEKGKIIRSNPENGVLLTQGQSITLYVSLGARQATMPTVIGEKIDNAKLRLDNAGFKNLKIVEEVSALNKGIVIRQSEAHNATIPADREIVLYVSKGIVSIDNCFDVTINPQDYFNNVPLSGNTAHLQIFSMSDDGDPYALVYTNELVSVNSPSLTFQLIRGRGTQEYLVYVNERPVSTRLKVDFSK